MSVNLSERAMLVTLTRSAWGGERTDREVSNELAEAKGATKRSSRVVKHLLPPEALAGVKAASGEARQTHYRYTLPWRDSGPRILRSAIYSEYIAAMRDAKAACDAAEQEFYTKYDVFKTKGMAELGAMVNAADYPTLEHVKSMFKFDLDVSPVPIGGDFRVDTPEAASIREAIDQSTQAAAEAGLKAKLTEAAEIVGRMVERLTVYRPGEEGQRATGTFKDSLVENVRELAIMLPKINLFEDPRIDQIASMIETNLGAHDASDLRENEGLRWAVKNDAEDILSRLEGYL